MPSFIAYQHSHWLLMLVVVNAAFALISFGSLKSLASRCRNVSSTKSRPRNTDTEIGKERSATRHRQSVDVVEVVMLTLPTHTFLHLKKIELY